MKVLIFILAVAVLMMTGSGQIIPQDQPVKGTYLGQKPPGTIPEVFAPRILSTGYPEICISFTPDGKEVYYTVGGPPHSVILFMKEVDSGWGKPEVAPFSGKYSSEFQLSPDGNKIYFSAGIPLSGSGEPKGNWDIWMVEKSGTQWGYPILLPPPLSSDEYSLDCPSVAANGNLYFYSSNLPGGKGKGDIWVSKLVEGKYAEPENLSNEINTEHYDMDPYIAPDESYLIFASDRPGGSGSTDLYISFKKKTDGTWTEAVNLGEKINSDAQDIHPSVTGDGKYLFFCSTRRIVGKRFSDSPITYKEKMAALNSPGNGVEDIYWVDARILEEFKPGDEK